MFKPGVADINKKGELMAWSNASNINYIKNPEEAIHNTG
jgi:hypothetical protein